MNWEYIEERWDFFRQNAGHKWNALSEDELTMIGGKREKLIQVLKQRYGYLSPFAEEEVDRFYGFCIRESGNSGTQFPSGTLIAPPNASDDYISS